MPNYGLTGKGKASSAVPLVCLAFTLGALVLKTWGPFPAWAQASGPTEEVLKALEQAFDSKDPELFATLLSSQYQFVPACSTPEGTPVLTDRKYELEMIKRLFANYLAVDAGFSVVNERARADTVDANVRFSLIVIDNERNGLRFEATERLVFVSSAGAWSIASWADEPAVDSDGCSSPWQEFRESIPSAGESESVIDGISWGEFKYLLEE